ncbi:MAG: aminoacyl-tRNA hydrolase [Ardenticatenales bacterium]|nr:aminoacyl-tRNA hydrolase [Ardenticatenales bacterium]
MHLIVGLGNPGTKYTKHRHNIGFQVLDVLAARHSLSFDKTQSEARIAVGTIQEHKVLLAKPQSYMNDSGRPVRTLLNFYKIPLSHLIVVYDDLDLPLGRIRLRPQGSAGGQRGVKSMIQLLGTDVFSRVRVGIGRPPGQMDPAAYVLQDFSAEQEEEMAITRQKAADALETWLAEGIEVAMNSHNG